MRLVGMMSFLVACGVEGEPGEVEEAEAESLMIGGGCHPSSPNWPQCDPDQPSIPGGNCAGYATCYSFCRLVWQCEGPDWDECDALGDCLTGCDEAYSSCW